MIKKTINFLILIFWTIASIVWIISMFTDLVITKEIIRNISAVLTIAGIIYGLLHFMPFKKPKNFVGIVTVSAVLITGITTEIFNWNGDWKTQTILYENGQFEFKTIEFQMQDKGALGYNRRIVEVTKLTSFLSIIEPVDTSSTELPWIKVDKEINELGLKY
ncbi:hypothetical protein KEM09_21790 [Carboxylicivirga mesophila]|uniref:DUF5673 domain-containing protein n=1 Tax=Carboxylicivirga mesophila TaxID=1166478 RepID=A0ABS5KJL3_9BACT|nr:hypothetical protein [Carboxylicivirga mesophila]MBS2214053.1 hypothetical protein [Carboxylicivirga mesophila]